MGRSNLQSTRTRTLSLLLLLCASVRGCEIDSPEPDYDAPRAHGGWEYRLIANGFSRPRGIVVDGNGNLLIVDSGAGVVRVELDDQGGTCMGVRSKNVLIDDPDLNHGIALDTERGILYASTSDKVYSWVYEAGADVDASSSTVVVENMDNEGHTTRTLLLSQQPPGHLLVSRGSNSNVDENASDIDTGHCQIKAFNLTASTDSSSPYDFTDDGRILGWGLRNSVGVAEHPSTGGIWSVENSVDQLRRDGEDIHRDNPGEELNFHGSLNESNGESGERGGNYGYPSCYALWSTEDFPNQRNLRTGDQFAATEEAERTGVDDNICNTDFVAPRLTFQAHTAPLDIKFAPDGSEALVSFHGSWNRDDPVGYRLASIPFSDGMPVAESDSMSAAEDVLTNPDISKCPNGCFRPVGLAWGEGGRLFMTSDSTGEVYVLQKTGASSSDDDDDSGGQGWSCPRRWAVLVSFGLLMVFQLV